MSKETQEMSFLEHLEVLRWHLVRSVSAIVVFATVAFFNKSFLFDDVIFAPKNADFITYRFLCETSVFLSGIVPSLLDKDTLCIGQNFPQLQNISMAGQFMTHLLISIVAGLIFAFPYVIWELWRFIRPALEDTEKRFTTGIVFFTSTLFTVGVVFGYFVIVPLSVNFFLTYEISEAVVNLPTLDTYISTLTTIVLASGAIFELPILVYFLTKIGLITPDFMRLYRKHAIVVSLVLAAVITPPDVFSQLLVTGPLLFLYEISIWVSAFVLKKENK